MSRPITQKQAAFLADLIELQKKHSVEIVVDPYDRYMAFQGGGFVMDIDDIDRWKRALSAAAFQTQFETTS